MEKAIISIVIGIIGFIVILAARVASLPKCPSCGARRRWQHSRKDGGPDLRFKYNSVVCEECSKLRANLEVSKPTHNIYLEIASKFKEDDWVVCESKKYPHARAIFRVYRDKDNRLQPFKNLDTIDINEYRHALPDEIPPSVN